jgi:hypothetical protein
MMSHFFHNPYEVQDLDCTKGLSEIDFVTLDELVRLPVLEIGLGIYRRSPLILCLVVGYGISWVILALTTLGFVTILPTIWFFQKGLRVIYLALKWEKLHRPTTPLHADTIGLIIALMFAFKEWLPWAPARSNELDIGSSPLGTIFMLFIGFPLLAWVITRWFIKKGWIAKRVIRRAKMYSRAPSYWLIRNGHKFTAFAAILITFVMLGIYVLLLDHIYYMDYSALFGYPRSASLVNVFLGGASISCLLGAAGTVIGMRRGTWSRTRNVFQTIMAATSIIIVGTVSMLVIVGHLWPYLL